MLLETSAVIDRLLLSREGIQVSAHALHAGDDLPCRAPTGSLERHVFCEVRHSALAEQLVARAGINGDAEIDRVRLPRSADDAQSLGQRISEDFLVLFHISACKVTENIWNYLLLPTKLLICFSLFFHAKGWQEGGKSACKQLNIRMQQVEERFPPLSLVQAADLPYLCSRKPKKA